MTFNTFTEKLKKIRSSNIAGAKLLISDLEESTNMCNAFNDDFPIEYIRLKGSYPKATIKRVFSILGVEVTRVTKKAESMNGKLSFTSKMLSLLQNK